jgi:hypothetical protein
VAPVCGLTRDQYYHVRSSFIHSNNRAAPRRCLANVDELQQIDLEAFFKKHAPYWDAPLNENLAKPVINLPMTAAAPDEATNRSTCVIFDFQTVPTPPGIQALLTTRPAIGRRRKIPGASHFLRMALRCTN